MKKPKYKINMFVRIKDINIAIDIFYYTKIQLIRYIGKYEYYVNIGKESIWINEYDWDIRLLSLDEMDNYIIS